MKYVVLALMVSAATAHADDLPNSYASFELAAGAQLPLGDSTWNDAASTSPTGRAGLAYHMGEHLGFAGSVAATRELGLISRPLTHAAEMWRTMFLVHAFYEQRVAKQLVIEPRLGVGVDVAFTDYNVASTSGGGEAANTSEVKAAFAVEPALGAWVDVGVGFQVGGEVALPCTFGRSSGAVGPAGASYSSIEFSLLAGIRVTSLRD